MKIIGSCAVVLKGDFEQDPEDLTKKENPRQTSFSGDSKRIQE